MELTVKYKLVYSNCEFRGENIELKVKFPRKIFYETVKSWDVYYFHKNNRDVMSNVVYSYKEMIDILTIDNIKKIITEFLEYRYARKLEISKINAELNILKKHISGLRGELTIEIED